MKTLNKQSLSTNETDSNEFELCSKLIFFDRISYFMKFRPRYIIFSEIVITLPSSPCHHRNDLRFKIKHKSLHLVLCILFDGDIATRASFKTQPYVNCLS